MKPELCSLAAITALVALACSGADGEMEDMGAEDDAMVLESADGSAGNELDTAESADALIGQAEQAWWYTSYQSSCYDPTGTDSVLAALAVATARELRRWQPVLDFRVSYNMLALSSTGKARCADGVCYNTQALLDLQRDGASTVQVRPGVRVDPSLLRRRLTWNHGQQKDCWYSFYNNCRVPDHEFRFLRSEPGACDMNHWFEVRTPSGGLLSNLGALQDTLIWVDEEDNSYIKFQTEGSNIAIDPTLGLNEVSGTTTGSCSAACTKIAKTNVAGQCCTCNGTKSYSRSSWNMNTYLCK